MMYSLQETIQKKSNPGMDGGIVHRNLIFPVDAQICTELGEQRAGYEQGLA